MPGEQEDVKGILGETEIYIFRFLVCEFLYLCIYTLTASISAVIFRVGQNLFKGVVTANNKLEPAAG